MEKKIKPTNISDVKKAEQSAFDTFDTNYHYTPYPKKAVIRKNEGLVRWEKRVKYGRVEVDTYSTDFNMNNKAQTFWNDLIDEVQIELSDKQNKIIETNANPAITYTKGKWTPTYAHIENIPKEKIDYVIDKILYMLFEPSEGYIEKVKYT